MKKFNLWGYSLLDLILLGSGLVCITVISIIFQSTWYVWLGTMIGILCVFTQAKGMVATQILGVINFIFYSYTAYTQKLYGEAILYLIIMLPLYVYGIVHWLKNRVKKENIVIVRSNLSLNEWLIMSLSLSIVSVGVYLLLNLLNTQQIIISTLSFVSMLPAVYLLVRRCKWNQVAFLINDFIVPILWLFIILEGKSEFIPLLVYHIFQVTYDVYGLINWIKLEKHQKLHKNRDK